MNREQYKSDPRYAKVLETMNLLNITDISTKRQADNGTIVWKLPIKNEWDGKLIEVASFKSGYVRNQNSAYDRSYQLNKRCQSEPEYFKLANGDYRKFETRTCELIPIEIDRLEYLISYCLKNYYIKNANQVADGEFVPKWKHEYKLEQERDSRCEEVADFQHESNIKIRDLENKLDTIKRIADYEENN
jgi:hypothetical protein